MPIRQLSGLFVDRPKDSNLGHFQTKSKNQFFLWVELFGLFVVVPALLYFWTPLFILPILWMIALWCGWILLKDQTFDRTNLWRAAELIVKGKSMLKQFTVISVLLFALVYFWAPDLLFSLVMQKPLLWLLILFLYPLLSAYPQELVYRAYFFYRYRPLFPGRWPFIISNALLFGYMHIIFHNWIAVSLTSIGGVLFALMYERSSSTLLVFIAHSLYGCLLFTLGLGPFFITSPLQHFLSF